MAIEFSILELEQIRGVYLFRPSVSADMRGNIWTSFVKGDIEKYLPAEVHFKHDKFSTSKQNVLRGIHGDTKSWKLVTCVHGEIHQVVVDYREGSPTYLKYHKVIINTGNQLMMLIPPNMGNSYFVSSKEAVYHYKLAYDGNYLDADEQFSLKWNDPRIGIEWPTTDPILSERDK